MPFQPREDYIHKLVLLEKHVGDKTSYKIFEPVSFNSSDVVQIQNIAKRIATFIGLGGSTFIVTRVKQKENVGGNVEITEKHDEVFIEISDDIARSESSILAVLAHEITHKYLAVYNISIGVGSFYTYENEILTDITSIFLGLGKLMLNGCDIETKELQQDAYGTHTYTHQVKCGYLDQEQLAFVYRLVCAMRGIPEREMISNLSTKALLCIKTHNIWQEGFFNIQFSSREYRIELLKTLIDHVQSGKNQLEEIRKYVEFLKEKYIGDLEKSIQMKNKEFNIFTESLKAIDKEAIYDPCLLFLNNIEIKKKIDSIQQEVIQSTEDIQKIRTLLDDVPKLNKKNKSQNNTDEQEKSFKSSKKSFFKRILR